MAGAQFLHGVEVVEITDGPRPIRTVRSSVIGIVGTAPGANAAEFPIEVATLVAGSRGKAAFLDTTVDGTGGGTLPEALDLIMDQIGAAVVVVRVEEGEDYAGTQANVIAGVHKLLEAQSSLGVTPRILIAPGFTDDRPVGVVSFTITNQGTTNYTTPPTVTITGGGGEGAEAHAVLGTGAQEGKVVSIVVDSPGRGYTSAPTVAFSGGGGDGAAATATTGPSANPVVAELLGIAERLKAIIIADLPIESDAAAVQYREDWGSKRVYGVYAKSKVADDGNIVTEWSSPGAAGLIAKTDNDRGFWWSPSNQVINGIVGTVPSVDFALGDANSRANFLNENDITTIIREDGFRLWGNRTFSDDPKFAFLNVVRTADIINESVLRAHLWAVDRNITKTYIDDVEESVNAYMRTLVALGAILGGRCQANPDLNTPASIAEGKVYFDIAFTPPYPAEHIVFRSAIVNDYLEDIV